MLRTSELDFDLPGDRVATRPAAPREAARLMVVSRSDPTLLEHRRVGDLPEHLRAGDLLVVNTSRVLPARILGHRADTHGHAEGLYLGPALGPASGPEPALWRVLLKARRLREGVSLVLHDRDQAATELRLVLIARSPEEGEEGAWICRLEGGAAGASAIDVLERIGHTPLPPYIRSARKRAHEAVGEEADREAYQTAYAAPGEAPEGVLARSVAAPTAGLHLGPKLLGRLAGAGVGRADVVLHVGTGTFKTVETEFVEQHPMHAEWCRIPAATARAIVATRARGGRVIAVGTTSARTLESFGPAEALVGGGAEGWSKLLVTPGRAWANVDGLMTNFHLPRSTLLAMVAALFPEGIGRLLELYRIAIEMEYRFYSYGDAMLVLP